MTRGIRSTRSRRGTLAVHRLEDRTVPSSVQGTIFNDANNNGVFDSGEPGVSGWTVFVDNNRNTIADPGEVAGVTDANGHYMIDTTSVPTNNGWNYFSLDLQVGTGGRWLSTTAGTVYAHPIDEPAAVRDFGVHFEPYVSVEPDGPETLVNVTISGPQGSPQFGAYGNPISVASDTPGNYAVVWQTWDGANTSNIYARLFQADGVATTGEILVSTMADQGAEADDMVPQVAMANNGRFAVAWSSYLPGPGAWSTMARVYNANGTPLTATAITVAAGSNRASNFMSGVGMDADGDFAVLFENWKRSGPFSGFGAKSFMVQRYTPSGATNGKVIDAGSPALINGQASLAMDGGGRFVVVWDDAASVTGGYSNSIHAQRFTAAGKTDGARMNVATVTNRVAWQSNVSMNDAGRFVVSWSEREHGMKAQVYNWATPIGTNVLLGTPGDVVVGSDIDANGNATFAWIEGEIRFRHLFANGTLEPAIYVNTTTQGFQGNAGVAITGNDRFVIAWQGYGPGDATGIFMQRFEPVVAPRPGEGGERSDEVGSVDLRMPSADAVVPVREKNSGQQRNRLIDLFIADAELQPIQVIRDMSNEDRVVIDVVEDRVTDLIDSSAESR